MFKLSDEVVNNVPCQNENGVDDGCREIADKASAWTAWAIVDKLTNLGFDSSAVWLSRELQAQDILRPDHIVGTNKKVEGRPDFCPECGVYVYDHNSYQYHSCKMLYPLHGKE